MADMILAPLVTPIRIFPARLMGMLLWGFVCGAGLGGMWDVIRITRVLLGVRYPSRGAERLYEMPLPILRRTVSRPASGIGKRSLPQSILRHAVIFLEDVLFGVMWGVIMTLLIYFTNDGIFRAMAPIGMLCGFFAYYWTVGRLVLSLSQGIVFFLRAALCYLVAAILLPPRTLIWLWRHTMGAYLKRKRDLAREKRAERYHAGALRALTEQAERGWLFESAEKGMRKKEGGQKHAASSKTHQKNDDRIAERESISDADRCVCHHLLCHQNDAEQQAAARKRGAAKADRRYAGKI